MRFLHISPLPVWPMEGKGGMPSLRETLRGHVRISGGHICDECRPYQLEWILVAAAMFSACEESSG